jgi:hypothetical protein
VQSQNVPEETKENGETERGLNSQPPEYEAGTHMLFTQLQHLVFKFYFK